VEAFTDVVAFFKELLPIWVGYQTSCLFLPWQCLCSWSGCSRSLLCLPWQFTAIFSCELWAICQLFAYGLAAKSLVETSDDCQRAHGWNVWAVDLSLVLVAFVVAATVGSLKLTDIVNVQWGDILSGSSPVLLVSKIG